MSLPRTMVAIVTPFDDQLGVDTDAHAHNVGLLVEQGCLGFLVAGSTGEGPYLEPGERGLLVASTRATAPDTTVVCGVNAESVRQATEQIGEAADAGADVALVCTPGTLIRGNDAQVSRFFELVASASPIPILLYSVPKVTGYILPTSIVTQLADHDAVIGMKDSGGDPSRLADLTPVMSNGFMVFAGASRVLAESHDAGAFGAITASANYAFTLVDAARSGDVEGQRWLTSVISVVEAHGLPGTKFAAEVAGMTAGSTRPPLSIPAPGVRDAIADAAREAQQHRHG